MSDEEGLIPAYIAKKSCGCVVFAIVDRPDADAEFRKILAKELASCVRQGLTVERVTVDYIRKLPSFGCKHEEGNPKKKAKSGQGTLGI